MKKSLINPMPQFFDRYIHIVEEDDLFKAFKVSIQELEDLDIPTLKSIGDKVYQTGKWTIKDIIQHVLDNERIQAYRALRFARRDETVLPGYDEALFARNVSTQNRTIEELIEELKIMRTSTLYLFKSFSEDALLHSGTSFNQKISVTALGFVIIGHQQHHFKILQERYFPLV